MQFGPKLYRFTTTDYDSPLLVGERGAPAGRAWPDPAPGAAGDVLPAAAAPRHAGLRWYSSPSRASRPATTRSASPANCAAAATTGSTSGSVNDWAVPVPDGARPVLMGTEAYWDALAQVQVHHLQRRHAGRATRSGQARSTCRRGTARRSSGSASTWRNCSRSAAPSTSITSAKTWPSGTCCCRPTRSAPRILRQAFRFGGEISRVRLPAQRRSGGRRRRAAAAAAVRRRIGLPAGKRVVMYAPTWRDNQFYASGRYRFDLRLDLERA